MKKHSRIASDTVRGIAIERDRENKMERDGEYDRNRQKKTTKKDRKGQKEIKRLRNKNIYLSASGITAKICHLA